jgi:hypothetical protein
MHGKPDYHAADLLLKVYDLRREAVLREARSTINREFWPTGWEDVKAAAQMDHPLNVALRQTGTYWEMVYGFARHGIVPADFWIENNGEGLFLFARVEPFLADIRQHLNPRSFVNAEWMSNSCDEARQLMAFFRKRIPEMRAARGR